MKQNNKEKISLTPITFSKLSFNKASKKFGKQLSPILLSVSPIAEKPSFLEPLSDSHRPPSPLYDNNNEGERPALPKSHSATDLRTQVRGRIFRSFSQTSVPVISTSHYLNRLSHSSGGSSKNSTIAIARKHSLPPTADLFQNDQPVRPYMTLAEFKRMDKHPRQQRAILAALQRQDNKLRKEGVIKDTSKTLKGKKDRKLSKAKESIHNRSTLSLVRRGSGSSGAIALKFLGIKKGKKRTTSVLLNNLILAIRDNKVSDAITILSYIPNSSFNSLKKKKSVEANRAFLMAIAHRMDDVALAMYERGIPGDVNSPILVKNSKNTDRGGISGLKFPSYFILAVALGLNELVKAMVKRANMNQTWFGLSPLIIAVSQATIAYSSTGLKSKSRTTLLIKLLLDNGADPSQGLPLEQFNTLRKLKAKHYMRRLNILNSFKSDEVPSESDRFDSVPQQYGSIAWNSKQRKEEMENFSKGKWVLPIDIAAVAGNLEIVRMLLSRMDVSSVSSSSFCLSVQRDVMLTLELAHSGANVNQRDLRGNMPIHIAARSGHVDMVVILLQLGTNVNAKGENDWTPLHEAMSQKYLNICSILITAGADTKLVNNKGKTAIELGLERGLTQEQINQFLGLT
ncbi:ankyrin [Gigaspora margarita]|uniref:Ankyrin n=1 Tax=Gigaspora margarita TaxID=4874 RepID=A0A8H4EKP7_GIGMA|nr:ankyrin [Gigaspora margarita]